MPVSENPVPVSEVKPVEIKIEKGLPVNPGQVPSENITVVVQPGEGVDLLGLVLAEIVKTHSVVSAHVEKAKAE